MTAIHAIPIFYWIYFYSKYFVITSIYIHFQVGFKFDRYSHGSRVNFFYSANKISKWFIRHILSRANVIVYSTSWSDSKKMIFLFSILRFKFFVYSAYFDDRVGGTGTPTGKNQGMVRIISATKTRGPERVWCRLWYRPKNGGNVTTSVTVAAKVKVR